VTLFARKSEHRGHPIEAAGWFLVLAAVTAWMIPHRGRLNEAHVALAYLLIVQFGSARGGRLLGMSLAAAAFLCFDWFFLPPYGTLALSDPLNWLVLLGFLVTSLVATQLLYRARSEAEVARRHAREIDRLAGVAAESRALQESHRAKDAVLASVSHDLRTPLTTIKALAHELADAGDERAMIIEQESDRLTRFVADVLDLSSISSGITVDAQPNEADDLLGAAAQRVTGRLEGRTLEIKVDPDDPILIGRFDFAHTLRAIVNLIENAVKYSPPNGVIELAARREGAELAFTVSDRGAGIPELERERVFEPFYRHQQATPDVGGSGLGLSIARGLAEAQGGSLSYAPRPGGGSVFSLRVPALSLAEVNRLESLAEESVASATTLSQET
jgi:K+-sensing histidine kinase KdpD